MMISMLEQKFFIDIFNFAIDHTILVDKYWSMYMCNYINMYSMRAKNIYV